MESNSATPQRNGATGGQFRKLPIEFRDRQQELTGARLSIWLCYLLHENSESGVAWISLSTLQKKTGVKDVRWLRQERASLVQEGWLVREGSKPGKRGGAPVPCFKTAIPQPTGGENHPVTNSPVEKLTPPTGGVSHLPTGGENHPRSRSKEVDEQKKSATAVASAWDFAFGAYRDKFHESPNWFKKDRVELDALLSRKPELTLDEFRRRWTSYLKSTDPFYIKNGYSLGFFCKHAFDALRDGPQNERSRDVQEKPYGGITRRELERRRSELSPEGKRAYERRGVRVQ